MLLRGKVSQEQALHKIKRYCAYQERCHKDVMGKLYDLGLYKKDAELLVSQLIEEGFLNEERFAIQYAGGKFRIKQWGKKKIEFALKEKQVSRYCIKIALSQIEEKPYLQTLSHLASVKREQLKDEKNMYVKMRKLQDYLLQKGYEYELVKAEVNKIAESGKG